MKKIEPQHQKIYDVYYSILTRCYNPNHKQFKDYGERGIKVCDEWRNSFVNFLTDMWPTYQEGLTIDRIDNNLGYSKENCKWSTRKEQNRNQTKTRIDLIKAEEIRNSKLKGVELAKIYGVSNATISMIRHLKTWI